MKNLIKAKDLYLRGFRSTYIKRRTGILSGELKKEFPELDKQMIIKYQIDYLRTKYSADEIALSLEQALSAPNAESQVKGREMQVLGCCFGHYDKVFSELLGKDRFLLIKKHCAEVRMVTPQITSREARERTMIERYGSRGPNGNPEIASRMVASLKKTNLKLYGVESAMQVPEKAAASAKHRQETMIKRYGAGNSVQIPEVRNKILESRKRNGTLTSSKHEMLLYRFLIEQFGEYDVIRNYKDDRYPFYADFYVKSRDLFIELNADKSHGSHWFDESSEKDIERVMRMRRKAEEIDLKNNPANKSHKSRYWNYLRVWTVLDVEKRKIAKEQNLNYLVFWDDVYRVIDGIKQPRLKDARAWFDAGCPDSKNWNKENTW